MLANVPDRWRCLSAAALYTGMRKGELLGSRIRRSADRMTTALRRYTAFVIARTAVSRSSFDRSADRR